MRIQENEFRLLAADEIEALGWFASNDPAIDAALKELQYREVIFFIDFVET